MRSWSEYDTVSCSLYCEEGLSFSIQSSTTILGIIEMCLRGISYDDCCSRYGVGNSTVNLIMSRYWAKGIPLEVFKQMPGSARTPLGKITSTAEIEQWDRPD